MRQLLSVPLPSTPDAPARGRAYVRALAVRWAGELTEDALLLTSELLTNAVRYGGGGVRLSVTADSASVRIAVSDDNPRRPILTSASPEDLQAGGRGLLILQALAHSWGVQERSDPAGKTVWFDLPLI